MKRAWLGFVCMCACTCVCFSQEAGRLELSHIFKHSICQGRSFFSTIVAYYVKAFSIFSYRLCPTPLFGCHFPTFDPLEPFLMFPLPTQKLHMHHLILALAGQWVMKPREGILLLWWVGKMLHYLSLGIVLLELYHPEDPVGNSSTIL